METTIDEIAEGIYRLSTMPPDSPLNFNQFLVDADEPMLFHCGHRMLFDSVSTAAARVVAPGRLRWISFGHVEADECGSLNSWLAASPDATVAFGQLGVMVSVGDLADRAPRGMAHDEVLDLGGKRLRYLATPHVPHGWEAGIWYEETTGTLLAGDLFTQAGTTAALTESSVVEAAVAAEDAFGYSSLAPSTCATIESLAALEPRTLALMHGASFTGDGGAELRALAVAYAERMTSS